MHETTTIGDDHHTGFWLDTDTHRSWLRADAARQIEFFRASLRPDGGFYQLDGQGAPIQGLAQELFATTRMVHSFALASKAGFDDCDVMIDHGMQFIMNRHHDPVHDGYVWSLAGEQIEDDRKLAYGHAFVMLAASSAMQVGHPAARGLLDDITRVMTDHFWEAEAGLFADEANRDWTPFSTYHGFNANMHSTESLLNVFEATGDAQYLDMAGSILNFFVHKMAARNEFRLPEHYTQDWVIDRTYAGDPMFRPAGTTPGHSFEMARLLLQHWDLSGRRDDRAPVAARQLVDRALSDAWNPVSGGLIYTVGFDGTPDVTSRYWWPVTEAIGVLATLIKLECKATDEEWYRRLWKFADSTFIDHEHGGWYPEIDPDGAYTQVQFTGKPDIYHSLQASLLPLTPGISGAFSG